LTATPLLLREKKSTIDRQAFRQSLQGLFAALRSRSLYLVAAFLFLYSFSPGFGTPLYYHMTDQLHFAQSYIGLLGSITAAGWIAGALVHRVALRRMAPKPLLYLSVLLGTVSTASFLLLSGELSAALVNFGFGVSSMIATIATLTLAPRDCRVGGGGFAFAGLMSVSNLAEIFSINIGAWLYEHVFDSRLAPLILVSAAATAAIALFIPLLRLDGQGDRVS